MTNTKPQQTPATDIDGTSEAESANAAEPEVISADEIVEAEAQAEADAAAEINEPVISDTDTDADDADPHLPTEQHIEALEAQIVDLTDKYLRTVAEMENVRRRAQREKEDASKYAITKFAREMLSVSDNMTRAFASVEGEGKGAEASPDDIAGQFKNFMDGVKLTEADLMKTLEGLGLKKIEPIGQRFDANLHEALFELEDKSQTAGTVAQVLEQGFTLNGRLLRAAKVGITKGGPKFSAKAAEQTARADADEAATKEGKSAYETKTAEPGSQLNEEL